MTCKPYLLFSVKAFFCVVLFYSTQALHAAQRSEVKKTDTQNELSPKLLDLIPAMHYMPRAVWQNHIMPYLDLLDLKPSLFPLHLQPTGSINFQRPDYVFNDRTKIVSLGFDQKNTQWKARIIDIQTNKLTGTLYFGVDPAVLKDNKILEQPSFHFDNSNMVCLVTYKPIQKAFLFDDRGAFLKSFDTTDHARLSGHGKFAATHPDDKTIIIVDTHSGKVATTLNHAVPFLGDFTRDGNHFTSFHSEKSNIIVWDINTGKEMGIYANTALKHNTIAGAALFSRDGTKGLLCSPDGTLKLRDLYDSAKECIINPYNEKSSPQGFSDDDMHFLVSSAYKIHKYETDKAASKLKTDLGPKFISGAMGFFSPDGTKIFSMQTYPACVAIMDSKGKELAHISKPLYKQLLSKYWLYDCQFSTNNKQLFLRHRVETGHSPKKQWNNIREMFDTVETYDIDFTSLTQHQLILLWLMHTNFAKNKSVDFATIAKEHSKYGITQADLENVFKTFHPALQTKLIQHFKIKRPWFNFSMPAVTAALSNWFCCRSRSIGAKGHTHDE